MLGLSKQPMLLSFMLDELSLLGPDNPATPISLSALDECTHQQPARRQGQQEFLSNISTPSLHSACAVTHPQPSQAQQRQVRQLSVISGEISRCVTRPRLTSSSWSWFCWSSLRRSSAVCGCLRGLCDLFFLIGGLFGLLGLEDACGQ